MSYFAYSTKERYNELQKNPLVFCKYGSVNVPDEIGYNHATEAWTSCDQTIRFMAYEKDLSKNESGRKLFVIGQQIRPNGKVDEKKEDQDDVKFEIVEFDAGRVLDWQYVFNDCLYNFKSGNTRHCHMALFWALYTASWDKEVIRQALSQITSESAKTACSYISANIFVFALNKQYILVDLLKEINPNIQPLGIPEIDAALKEIASEKDFSNFGFYQKVDYILAFGKQSEEQGQLEKLYRTSRNGFINFKYWMNHTGHKFYNYDFLEIVYSYVNSLTQLSIVKRYLHDVRIKLIEIDYTLIQNMRDTRCQAFVDIRYFITTPGDNIDLVAPMFCDAILTLKKSEGKKIQDFNGILDFAVSHSNKAYPKIDLGIRHFLPTCDGGLMHNSSFYGFIHYALIYTFDKSKLTEESLKQTVDYLINRYASLQYHDVCKSDNHKALSPSDSEKCRKVITTFNNKYVNGKITKQVLKYACPSISHEPIKPYVWKRTPGSSDQILSLFIDNIESKEYLRLEDINIDKLKKSLLMWGRKYNSFYFMNGNPSKILREKEVSLHIALSYYSPTEMEIYPNDSMFYSSKKSFLGAWNPNDISPNQKPEEIAQRAESSIVYANTFESLKKMFPDAEFGKDYVKLPFDNAELNKIKAFYHYRQHDFDPEKGYSETPYRNKEFLLPRKIQGIFYCTPKLADNREKVSNLPFFWCRSDECFCNMLDDQTLDRQSEWKQYTLYHAAEIMGYKLIEVTDKGNIPVETVANFAGEVRQAEKLYARLICKSCGHMIFSTRGSLLNGSRFFACVNSQCRQYRKEIYLSQCNNCKRGLIDSRDSKKCENGWVICPTCLACCNDDLFDRLIERHRRNGRVPFRLQESQGKGHNNKNIFFCPNCGTQLGDIIVEDKVRLDDGTEDIIQSTVFGCPHCNRSYEKELKKYRDSNKQ